MPVFFHSEHRMIPWLREIVPDPVIEINPQTAKDLGIVDGEWVIAENNHGSAKFKTLITPTLALRLALEVLGEPHAPRPWCAPCSPLGAPAAGGVAVADVPARASRSSTRSPATLSRFASSWFTLRLPGFPYGPAGHVNEEPPPVDARHGWTPTPALPFHPRRIAPVPEIASPRATRPESPRGRTRATCRRASCRAAALRPRRGGPSSPTPGGTPPRPSPSRPSLPCAVRRLAPLIPPCAGWARCAYM